MTTGEVIALIKALSGGGGSGGLPSVTESDAGKVLAVDNSGVWGAQEPIGKKFIVTLTPTSEDYSGTMDKTVAEINAAYEAGQEIVMRVMTGTNTYIEAKVTERINTGSIVQNIAYIIMTDRMIEILTETNYGESSTAYVTAIYELTRAT